MRYNTDPRFVGYEVIKSSQREQLDSFEVWAFNDKWSSFHVNHYDWWMFPIDEPSRFSYAWTVYEGDVAELVKDEVYIRNYLRGAELLSLSWGWDLYRGSYIGGPHRDQGWQGWSIRLYKASKSLKLFGFSHLFESLRAYANDLMDNGERMEYNVRDLGLLFR
ncbi:hypothetical protein A3K78_01245 [Candidatus Bathyarchaeota archaeon RBG_13_52_12]|nr:MAG: hypothetical protein A3K78_01245 [Candidatus Bathyarchaeota archaeon RBG_13_52_12]